MRETKGIVVYIGKGHRSRTHMRDHPRMRMYGHFCTRLCDLSSFMRPFESTSFPSHSTDIESFRFIAFPNWPIKRKHIRMWHVNQLWLLFDFTLTDDISIRILHKLVTKCFCPMKAWGSSIKHASYNGSILWGANVTGKNRSYVIEGIIMILWYCRIIQSHGDHLNKASRYRAEI